MNARDTTAFPLPPNTVSDAEVFARHRAQVSGSAHSGTAIVFAHGFGCDQHVWRFVAPAFEASHRVVVFDFVGACAADAVAYDRQKYGSLEGHAADLLELCAAVERQHAVERIVLVAHSVAAMIAVVAARIEPLRFAQLVLVCPSPRYIDEGDYVGGFARDDIEELFDTLDSNYFGWARMMAPVIMGNADRPELGEELGNNFCQTDPQIARHFARVTFLADNRADLAKVTAPALILQCSDDALAPPHVGEYVHERMAGSRLEVMHATGHCPHMSAPKETLALISDFVVA